MVFQSTKVFDGFSCNFRQFKATHSHCQYLHSYVTKIKVWFEGELDDKNWIQDFGSFKINGIKEKLNYLLDHTTLVAENDPEIEWFKKGEELKTIRLRIIKNVGSERYAEYIFNMINEIVIKESEGRVKVFQVEFFEHDKNSAIYKI